MTGIKKNTETLTGDRFFDQIKWDEEAPYYDLMNKMETVGTEIELDCLQLSKEDVVLDIGCGPGRMTVPLARRTKKVYAIDFSPVMVDICRKNCIEGNVNNVECILSDWRREEIGISFPEVDVVMQARWSGGASTFDLFQKAARKYAVIIEWAKNPPRVARDILFANCYSEEAMNKYPELRPFDTLAYSDQNQEYQINKVGRDKKLIEELKARGIEVHKKILEEGWDLSEASEEKLVEVLKRLSRHPECIIDEVFIKNVRRFVTYENDKVNFHLPMWSKIVWFGTRD